MSFIKLTGIDDVTELPLAPEGLYDLVITSQSLKESKDKSGQNVLVVLDIENADRQYAKIFHYLALPRGVDADKDANMMLMIKRFLVQFGVPMDGGFDLEALVGCRASGVRVIQEEFEGKLGNKIQVDRLPAE